MQKNIFKTNLHLPVEELIATNRDDFTEYLTTDKEIEEVVSINCVGSKNNLVVVEVAYKMPNHLYEDYLADKYDLEYNEYGQLIYNKEELCQ